MWKTYSKENNRDGGSEEWCQREASEKTMSIVSPCSSLLNGGVKDQNPYVSLVR